LLDRVGKAPSLCNDQRVASEGATAGDIRLPRSSSEHRRPCAGESASADELRLPPGPPLPRTLQTLGFVLGRFGFIELCRRRYGGAVTFETLFDQRFVMVFEPALAKQLFQGPHEQLNAGEANEVLGPILGRHSVLLLDGAEHLRHRRLLLPAFHGRQLAAHEQAVRDAADAEIDSWPLGEPFALLASMQSLTLRVIADAVFGRRPDRSEDDDASERELHGRVRAMIDPLGRPGGLLSTYLLPQLGIDRFRRRFERARRAVDELLYAEIERRRADPSLEQRDDVFSALLLARDQRGEPLSDREVRDELLTLLLAGSETTATGLAWALDLLLHDPRALERARTGEPAYLDAVVREALRLRPVIPGVGRVVRKAPFRLGQWVIPVGLEINPSIRIIHRRADLYPQPRRFLPERFLVADPPDTYTWLPFGGGTRRCLGASFALMEMRVALARILERSRLRAVSRRPERAALRVITLAPKHGVRVVLEERAPRQPAQSGPGSPPGSAAPPAMRRAGPGVLAQTVR
jgi:cytochrome P450